MLALPKKHVTSAGLAAMSMIIRGGIIEERISDYEVGCRTTTCC